ncbi:MAG: sigma-54-dependent Fis family transcriptional regulator [Verrucomicrobia bacterium]|nr:sigma-54-dependent Fis family transcriptional regulator [Verrucomicrobiota bacterium]
MSTPPSNALAPARILIVDDDPGQRSLLDSFLRGQGFATTTVESGEAALARLAAEPFAMMISDVRMPGMSGLDTLRRARQQRHALPVLLVTAYADIRDAVNAMRDGAVNYLAKPIDLDELLATVRRAVGLGATPPRGAPGQPLPANLVAVSPLMQSLIRDAALVAASDSRVLISGESGSGKGMLAELIHAWSPRAGGPLIKVNCSALTGPELETALFGPAGEETPGGAFAAAAGGTLVLDDVDGLPAALQARLLRWVEDDAIAPPKEAARPAAAARLIAVTRLDLEDEVTAGRFREDLFYRLSVVELNVPPLRERTADILPLATILLAELTDGRARLSASVNDPLTRYAWPGNVRELRNALERAALLSRGELILPDHLPARVREAAAPPASAEPGRLEDIERQAILQALARHGFNRSVTARHLGISRRALLYKIARMRAEGLPVDFPGARVEDRPAGGTL